MPPTRIGVPVALVADIDLTVPQVQEAAHALSGPTQPERRP
jgi:hypothetical protein